MADILIDPERCAYPQETGHATHRNQGHPPEHSRGSRSPGSDYNARFHYHLFTSPATVYEITTLTGNAYFLMPYGYDIHSLPATAISGPEFIQKAGVNPGAEDADPARLLPRGRHGQ